MTMNPNSLVSGTINISTLLAFVFGVCFVITMLALAIWFPNPSAFQVNVFSAVLALSAGGVAGVIPGALHVNVGKTLKAGGAIAMAAIVWFTQPVVTPYVVTLKEPEVAVEPTMNTFLEKLDKGDAAGSYSLLDDDAKANLKMTEVDWQQLYDANIKGLGKMVTRKRVGMNSFNNPLGAPVGLYRQVTYSTKFANVAGCRAESVVVRATHDLHWVVASYQISPMTIECPT